MTEKKKGLFSNLFKPKDCGCGVSIVEERDIPAQDKEKQVAKDTKEK